MAPQEAKKIFYGQAIFVSVCSGTAVFLNGFLDHQDFIVTCLNFSGFLILGLAYKIIALYTSKGKNLQQVFFESFYEKSGKLDQYYTKMIIIRAG